MRECFDLGSGVLVQQFDALSWSLPVVSPKGVAPPFQSWLREVKPSLLGMHSKTGAVLFRGFGLRNCSEFAGAVQQLSPEVAQFDEESSPRQHVEHGVFTSTDYPNAYPIQFHNEYSYSAAWPMKLFFFCSKPAERGGQTPIADSRCVLAHISRTTREAFERHGVLYRRRFAENLGVSWQSAFSTRDRDVVLARCDAAGIQADWRGDELHTFQRGAATLRHPSVQDEVWFNHAYFFNVHALEPVMLRNVMLKQPDEDLSTNTYYGDGTLIGPDVVEEIRRAYASEALSFDWESGDLLMIDNMLCSHSRAPFQGERQVFVIMTEKVWRQQMTQ